jgi:hypothetical protein
MIWDVVLAQAQQQVDDMWRNPVVVTLVGVSAAAFFSTVTGVFIFLLKSWNEGLREDIQGVDKKIVILQESNHATDAARMLELGEMRKAIDEQRIAEAQRVERERADREDRVSRQAGSDRRFETIETQVNKLTGKIEEVVRQARGN